MSEAWGSAGGLEEQLAKEGFVLYPNKGTSMLPLIRQGRDLMRIDRVAPEEVRRYDAVLFRRGVQYVLHRVIRIRDGFFYIRGDHTLAGEFVRPEQIVGRLTEVIRDGKKVIAMDSPGMRAYARVWTWCFPIRYAAMRGARLIRKVFHRAKHKTTDG